MGCGGSKIDDLPLVKLCRERKELIKAASDHRYALAAAHFSYFESLSTVGEALRKFVDEELVAGHDIRSSPSSPPVSPVLTLPSDERKGSKSSGESKVKNSKGKNVQFSSSTSISHSVSNDDQDHRHGDGEMGDFEDSHLHLSESDSELSDGSGHKHLHLHNDSPSEGGRIPGIYTSPDNGMNGPSYGYNYPYANPYPYSDMYPYGGYGNYPAGDYSNYPPGEWSNLNVGIDGGNFQTRAYYMKKSATPMKSVVFEEPERHRVREGGQWSNSGHGYNPYPEYGNAGLFGFPMMGARENGGSMDREKKQEQPPPAPPSPPSVSTWDFLNIFETYDSYYRGYVAKGNYGIGSAISSPDSNEVREREGIPDLEDETENEMVKNVLKEKKKLGEEFNGKKHSSEATTSRSVPLPKSEGSSRELKSQNGEEISKAVPVADNESTQFSSGKETKSSSPDTIVSTSSGEDYSKKKGVSFEVEENTTIDMKSSELGSVTTLPAHGTRDLHDVVREIKNEFEAASHHGKEVAVLLEVGKLPYRSKGTLLRVFSRVMYLVAPSMLPSDATTRPGVHISKRRMKLMGMYLEDARRQYNMKSGNISSTLEKLYVWENKLYKEVKDEEKLRVIYQEKCKKLKDLDDRGADSSKIDATQASIRKLHTKIDVCIRTVDAISSRIHKLRDEELQPQLTELIRGLIRMWRSMFKCHQKQFQAIMESKVHSLKANTGFRQEANFRAIVELEVELIKWCNCFNQWVKAQKSYIDSLNGWLLRCISHEPEQTADGIAPFSPSRIGAPPLFVICNDWHEALENISEKKVSHAMRDFAVRLHQLWERQDEQQRQRTKAENMSKDFEKQLRFLRMERGKLEHDLETSSDKSAALKYTSESGVSRLDDLKVDLDSMRGKLEEERKRHKEAMKLVQDAASGSLHVGLVPIFETLGTFTSEVLKGYEQVRLPS